MRHRWGKARYNIANARPKSVGVSGAEVRRRCGGERQREGLPAQRKAETGSPERRETTW